MHGATVEAILAFKGADPSRLGLLSKLPSIKNLTHCLVGSCHNRKKLRHFKIRLPFRVPLVQGAGLMTPLFWNKDTAAPEPNVLFLRLVELV